MHRSKIAGSARDIMMRLWMTAIAGIGLWLPPAVKLAVNKELELLEAGGSPLGPGGEPEPRPVEEIRYLRATYANQYGKLISQRAEATKTLLGVYCSGRAGVIRR